MRAALAALVLLVLYAQPAAADCTGSGLAWACAAGTTPAQINTTISSATDGATLTFASGSYTWNATISLSNAKGVTFICESEWACDVTQTSYIFMSVANGTSTRLYRFSGFDFISPSAILKFESGDTGVDAVLTNFRFDHNRSTGNSAEVMQFGVGDGMDVSGRHTYVYGLFDHNEVYQSTAVGFVSFRGDSDDTPPSSPNGTANNMFFEDNYFEMSNPANVSAGVGFIDGYTNAGLVVRFNTFKNIYPGVHGVADGNGGLANYEFYGNLLIVEEGTNGTNDGSFLWHHQGSGEVLTWGNRVTLSPVEGHAGDVLVMQYYRDFAANPTTWGSASTLCDGASGSNGDGNRAPEATYRGYPCFHQPGRDFAGTLKPLYAWDNQFTDNGAKFDLVFYNQGGFHTSHFVANRDIYNAVSVNAQTSASSPFDGTTGVGFGTLAFRPTSCTKTSEAADEPNGGVGYFVWNDDSNDGSWNGSSSNPYGVNFAGKDGLLYACADDSPVTWTLRYTPYTYPHPLQGESEATPSAPSRLRLRRASLGDAGALVFALSVVLFTRRKGVK
jgi:hypothetical protein